MSHSGTKKFLRVSSSSSPELESMLESLRLAALSGDRRVVQAVDWRALTRNLFKTVKNVQGKDLIEDIAGAGIKPAGRGGVWKAFDPANRMYAGDFWTLDPSARGASQAGKEFLETLGTQMEGSGFLGRAGRHYRANIEYDDRGGQKNLDVLKSIQNLTQDKPDKFPLIGPLMDMIRGDKKIKSIMEQKEIEGFTLANGDTLTLNDVINNRNLEIIPDMNNTRTMHQALNDALNDSELVDAIKRRVGTDQKAKYALRAMLAYNVGQHVILPAATLGGAMLLARTTTPTPSSTESNETIINAQDPYAAGAASSSLPPCLAPGTSLPPSGSNGSLPPGLAPPPGSGVSPSAPTGAPSSSGVSPSAPTGGPSSSGGITSGGFGNLGTTSGGTSSSGSGNSMFNFKTDPNTGSVRTNQAEGGLRTNQAEGGLRTAAEAGSLEEKLLAVDVPSVDEVMNYMLQLLRENKADEVTQYVRALSQKYGPLAQEIARESGQ